MSQERSPKTSETASPPVTRRQLLRTAGMVGGLALDAAARANVRATGRREPSPNSSSLFALQWDAGTIASLKRAGDSFPTEYILPGRHLGHVFVRYRRDPDGEWQTARTEVLPESARTVSPGSGDIEQTVIYRIPADAAPVLTLTSTFTMQGGTLLWKLTLRNETDKPLEIGDLAVPLPMNTRFRKGQSANASVFKHSFISGDGSFAFWMRPNSVGPYLTLTPLAGSPLEYWDRREDGYRVYLHSVAAGVEAATHGGQWRQPHTSRTLPPAAGKKSGEAAYGLRFDWADGYEAVRQLLVENGLVDVHIAPGMTVPCDLHAEFALRTKQKIQVVEAEFPAETAVEFLGKKGDVSRYRVRFSRLGENRLTIRYGKDRRLYLEFFATEPLETLMKKRAAFIARHQHRNTGKWYEGLLAEWNNETQVMLGPDNYDRIQGWRIYEVTCDDPGLSKPAYLASKNAEHPVQSEVEALDYYIQHFVWGGLQRTTEETYPYALYGIPDWKTNRDSPDPGSKGKLHIWRCYDYPHIILTYFGLYRIARYHPQIKTTLPASEYLRRAAGTALAMFTVPMEITQWSAYETGFYNELVIVDLIRELEAVGLAEDAERLRGHWERKVRYFVLDSPDLFGSEYPFDSTGFESTHALARYALEHADTGAEAGGRGPMPGLNATAARRFLETQMAANIFCRGWLEPAYYLHGSDYRAGGGDGYTLSYMAQMGGWAVLDYALHFAADPFPYLRLGYASTLSSWALMNTGTPESGYGYWAKGAASDGAACGGFEPSAYGQTWLGQPHHRGAWYYSCEIDLGYCGALRAAATILADDPLFGRFCFGGDWKKAGDIVEIVPRDGVRRRFHALLANGGRLHLVSEVDRFKAGEPIALTEDLSRIRLTLESANPDAHAATLRLSGMPPGNYRVQVGEREVAAIESAPGRETVVAIPVEKGAVATPVTISRAKGTPVSVSTREGDRSS